MLQNVIYDVPLYNYGNTGSSNPNSLAVLWA